MSDDDLAAIRAKRLAELQAQHVCIYATLYYHNQLKPYMFITCVVFVFYVGVVPFLFL